MKVLITGANRGIGAALDVALQARGDAVLATARNATGYLPLDVTDPASHHALAKQLDGQAIDLLVCNAGVYLDKGQRLTVELLGQSMMAGRVSHIQRQIPRRIARR
nr:sugar nucleotide-binding protein [Paracoccaceae bacterium]